METPSKSDIFEEFCQIFGHSALPLSELISKVESSFWLQFFFVLQRYTLVVYGKNCLGDVATVYNSEK